MKKVKKIKKIENQENQEKKENLENQENQENRNSKLSGSFRKKGSNRIIIYIIFGVTVIIFLFFSIFNLKKKY